MASVSFVGCVALTEPSCPRLSFTAVYAPLQHGLAGLPPLWEGSGQPDDRTILCLSVGPRTERQESCSHGHT